jgi:hypothetical protein
MPLTTGEVALLASVAGLLGAAGGVLGRWYSFRKMIDDKQDASRCATCRKEVDAKIAGLREELRGETSKYGAAQAELGKTLAVLQAKLEMMDQTLHEVRQDVRVLRNHGAMIE